MACYAWPCISYGRDACHSGSSVKRHVISVHSFPLVYQVVVTRRSDEDTTASPHRRRCRLLRKTKPERINVCNKLKEGSTLCGQAAILNLKSRHSTAVCCVTMRPKIAINCFDKPSERLSLTWGMLSLSLGLHVDLNQLNVKKFIPGQRIAPIATS